MSTPYQSQYWAHALTLRGSGGDIAALSRSIANARVDLNPHQIDAALFALRSPFTNGAILADEVGLGKTVEAGIVLAQKWAERRRRILIIVPAILRNQWQQELDEKFFLPSEVLDGRVFNRLQKAGQSNPFDQTDKVVICSYNFAAAKSAEVAQVPWDVVVIDEAHRLRNVHRSRSRLENNPGGRKTMAHRITDAVGAAPKLLLTATPLQNSLLEHSLWLSLMRDRLELIKAVSVPRKPPRTAPITTRRPGTKTCGISARRSPRVGAAKLAPWCSADFANACIRSRNSSRIPNAASRCCWKTTRRC